MSSTFLSAAPRILVFDSGVGGLSVFAEIQRKLPHATLIYASDNAAFPYGTKGEAELIARVDAVLRALMAAHRVDLLVIACNTASTLTLPHVRQHFTVPVVGVVPAIKPAAAATTTGVIGLLATPATVARPYTHDLIHEHAAHCEVISVGSAELVQLAEQKLRGGDIQSSQLDTILEPFFRHPRARELDKVVLACTHFPLLRDELGARFGSGVELIDSGAAIARRVEALLHKADLAVVEGTAAPSGKPLHIAIFTQASPAVEALRPQLIAFGIHHLDTIVV